VMEAELLEPIPEIEETSYADINLHEEDQGLPSFSEPSELEEVDLLAESDMTIPSSDFAPEISAELSLGEDEELVAMEPEELAEEGATPFEDIAEAEPMAEEPQEPARPSPLEDRAPAKPNDGDRLKSEIKSVLSYLDKLLDSLPEEKIEEFARSEYFDTYKKLFEELGLV
jgi:pilus assembly protein FimV